MPAQKSFQQLFQEKQEIVWAPCIYDCVSAKTAEDIGFEALTISSYEQKHCHFGFPSMTQDEMYFSASYILRSSNLPVLVDGEDGGGTPMEVYKNVKRFAEAGAMAIYIEDMFNDSAIGIRIIGAESEAKTVSIRNKIIPAEIWASNIQAAVEACKGTDCMVIARIDSATTIGRGPIKMAGRPGISFDEAIERAKLGVRMGAPMTIPVIHTRGITITHMNTISRTVPYTASPADLKVSFCVQLPILMMAKMAYITMNWVAIVKLSPSRLARVRIGA